MLRVLAFVEMWMFYFGRKGRRMGSNENFVEKERRRSAAPSWIIANFPDITSQLNSPRIFKIPMEIKLMEERPNNLPSCPLLLHWQSFFIALKMLRLSTESRKSHKFILNSCGMKMEYWLSIFSGIWKNVPFHICNENNYYYHHSDYQNSVILQMHIE